MAIAKEPAGKEIRRRLDVIPPVSLNFVSEVQLLRRVRDGR